MLSYLHHFHAGNHADVLKHWLLLECVRYLQLKDKPFTYIDTHAGAGVYRIDSNEALKTQEAQQGVLKINWDELSELDFYGSMVNEETRRKRYPGSPLLVKKLLRADDRAWLFEMHPKVINTLRQHCEERGRCYVRQQDGFAGLLSLLPVKGGRALVLIDPSYEVKSDYQTVVDTLAKAHKKMPQAMMLAWYPVVNRQRIDAMERQIQNSPLKNVQLFEIGVADDSAKGMTASGMVIVNPPWTLSKRFNDVAEPLSTMLSTDQTSRWQFKQLVDE